MIYWGDRKRALTSREMMLVRGLERGARASEERHGEESCSKHEVEIVGINRRDLICTSSHGKRVFLNRFYPCRKPGKVSDPLHVHTVINHIVSENSMYFQA